MLQRVIEIAKNVFGSRDNQPKKNPARSFRFESLEDKQLLTKLIDFSGGVVSIEGDNTNDTAYVYDQGSRVFVNLDGYGIRSFLRSTVNSIEFRGGHGNDIFKSTSVVDVRAYGNDGNDSLTGGLGNDLLNGGDGSDRLFGNYGDDNLLGGRDDDQLFGGEGNDRLSGEQGNDRMFGQAGDDRLIGGSGDDLMSGDSGDDSMFGNAGHDEMRGDEGKDLMYGQNGDDVMHGGLDNDRIFGGNDNDRMYGDQGDDLINGQDGADMAWGGSDNDTIQLGDGDDTGYGEWGDDKVLGASGNDMIYGGPGRDRLVGNAGHDKIWGGGGPDTLLGMTGNDHLFGENGPDILKGDSGDDSLYGGNHRDRLYGGTGLDGLFGGIDSKRDLILGEEGEDRFLFTQNDQLGDRFENNEAIVYFENTNSSWTDREVEIVDAALRKFHFRLQNTDLLKDTISDEPIVFVKTASLSGNDDGRNDLVITRERFYNDSSLRWEVRSFYERKIVIADWNEAVESVNDQKISLTINLMAKSWDSITELTSVDGESQQRWRNFMLTSDWTPDFPFDPINYQLSQDGLWWYATGSSFAKATGSMNPSEDWSTVWDYYYTVSTTSSDAELNDKLDQVDSLFVSMTQK